MVVTGSGSLDLTGLTFYETSFYGASVDPSQAELLVGPLGGNIDIYTGASGPSSFGTGGSTFASSGTGDVVSVLEDNYVSVPAGYVSGDPLSDSSTYDNTTFAALGLTPGTYTWTWGEAPDDSFVLNIGTTPLPAALPLFAGGLGMLGLFSRRRKRPA